MVIEVTGDRDLKKVKLELACMCLLSVWWVVTAVFGYFCNFYDWCIGTHLISDVASIQLTMLLWMIQLTSACFLV